MAHEGCSDLAIKNGAFQKLCESLPEGKDGGSFHRFWYLYQRINDEKTQPNRDFSQGRRSGTAAALCCFDAPWPSWTRPTEKICC